MTSALRSVTATLAVALALAVAIPGTARAYHLDDSLRGSTTGNAEGGSFGADGWTVNTPTDRLWFVVPSTPASGSIEFSVTSMTIASLFAGDNDIFTMYDALGVTEPIPYLPDFGRNNYKIWLRVRTEPGLVGMQKLVVAMCPDAASSWAEVCPCGPGFVEEVTAGDPAWDGSTQRMRFEFGGGAVRFLRNGVEVNNVDYATTTGFGFGPRELHFSIGSTRSRAVGYSGMPIGAVFSDLVVDTVDGPIASCPGSGPIDAGTPVDGGPCDVAGLATQDVTAASWETGVYSIPSDLVIEADGAGAPVAIVYLKFPAVGGPVTRATLTMHTAAVSNAAGGSGQICRVDSSAWDETTLTWSSRPAVSSVCSGGEHSVAAASEVSWDVTSLILGSGEQSFAIVTSDPDSAQFYSRDEGGCTRGPRLTVELGAESDGGVLPFDSGVAPGDAAIDLDADSGERDAGGRDRSAVTGDCGCRAAGTSSDTPPGVISILAAMIAVAVRRRPRAPRPTADGRSASRMIDGRSPTC